MPRGDASARRTRQRTGSRDLRPTTSKVRSAIFSMLGPAGPSGLRVLDLYAGTGALGLEALARGASQAVFVEVDQRRCEAIREAVRRQHFEDRGAVHKGDAATVVDRLEGEFDIVFVDPPYAVNPFERLLGRMETKGIVAQDAVIYLEHSARTELPDRLPGVRLVTRKVYGDTAVSVYRRDTEKPGEAPVTEEGVEA